MHSIRLNLKSRSYNIIVGTKILPLLGRYLARINIGTDAYIITNSAVKSRYGRVLSQGLKKYGFNLKFKTIPDGERAKDIRVASLLIRDLAKFDLKRRSFIIAFGGGVVGDLSGFVASIYKRGIPYIQVPTTLLAQVDSSIGGKTAIDLKEGKNLAGAFYQPALVFSDISLLKTLNKRQVANGLAEVIKYGVIKDKNLLTYIERECRNIIRLKEPFLEHIVKCCSGIKASIVSLDETEKKGLRTALNFGHTIGHAIEAAANFYKYNHGEAIALGMLVALEMSVRLKLINQAILKRIEALISSAGLPVKITGVSVAKILKKHFHDKKFTGKSNKFVLVSGLGKVTVVKDIPLSLIRYAIEKRL
ncbi:MAG: 3-dehydroquinate synthase [Candidatus Omnitrophica bacterium]|nr:3-dehydroquinate synthase [Candidatus Omnitrophota bacterium]